MYKNCSGVSILSQPIVYMNIFGQQKIMLWKHFVKNIYCAPCPQTSQLFRLSSISFHLTKMFPCYILNSLVKLSNACPLQCNNLIKYSDQEKKNHTTTRDKKHWILVFKTSRWKPIKTGKQLKRSLHLTMWSVYRPVNWQCNRTGTIDCLQANMKLISASLCCPREQTQSYAHETHCWQKLFFFFTNQVFNINYFWIYV